MTAQDDYTGGRIMTERMKVWKSPSGRLHLRNTCSGSGGPSTRARGGRWILVTESAFATAERCRCLPRFRHEDGAWATPDNT
jgi:hypothetical protein